MNPTQDTSPLNQRSGGPPPEAGLVRLALMVNVVLDRMTVPDADQHRKTA
jgi:hypothetical protein